MKKILSTLLVSVMLVSAIGTGAAGIDWSSRTLSQGTLTVTATGVEEGDRVAVEVFSDGVFSKMETIWAAGGTAEVPVTISEGENSARAFIWEKGTLCPKHPGSFISGSGIMDEEAIFSDNQYINNNSTIGYRTIEPIVGDYSLTFNLTVLTKGDNAIMLGDSTNGDLGYGTSSAILQFNGENFTTKNGVGNGVYTGEDAVTLCAVELNKRYTVTIQGNAAANYFKIKIDDGTTVNESPPMFARRDVKTGIDTIAFVSNSHNTTVTDGYYSGYYFYGTNFSLTGEGIDRTQASSYQYSGFEGMYYGLEVVETGNYIRGNNGALTADYTAVSDTSAMFIPRDMGDGSHAFECRSSSNRITQADSSVKSSAYSSADNTQHWVLEQSENYSADNLTYYMRNIESGKYIGISGTSLSPVEEASKKEIRFVPLAADSQSPLYRVSQTYVYNLLSDAQRERLESVYESVAGDVFGRYGGSTGDTPRIRMDNMFNEILSGSLTEAEQLAKLRQFLNATDGHIYDGQADRAAVSASLPGTEGLTWEIDAGTAGNYQLWTYDTYLYPATKYVYTIKDKDGSVQQTINIYVQDNDTAKANAVTYENTILTIPYVYRQYLQNVYIRNDGANSFNGGGGDMYVRINYHMSDQDRMRSTLVHELGHIVDQQFGHWSAGSGWSAAMAKDMYMASGYANTTNDEDFAEFSRLYFEAYGNPDMQRGLKIIMPARYASFGELRRDKLGGWGLWEDEYTTAN